eukprot:3941937-Rhodomonas_salina.4
MLLRVAPTLCFYAMLLHYTPIYAPTRSIQAAITVPSSHAVLLRGSSCSAGSSARLTAGSFTFTSTSSVIATAADPVGATIGDTVGRLRGYAGAVQHAG